MKPSRKNLPEVVTLPVRETVTSGKICEILGISRQTLYVYRNSPVNPMPGPFNGLETRMDALANWLITENVQVRWT